MARKRGPMKGHSEFCSCIGCTCSRHGDDNKRFWNFDFAPDARPEFWTAEVIYLQPDGSRGSISYRHVYSLEDAQGMRERAEEDCKVREAALVGFHVVHWQPAVVCEVVA